MTFKTNVLLVALLALFLAVPAVNASNVINSPSHGATYDIGDATSVIVNFNLPNGYFCGGYSVNDVFYNDPKGPGSNSYTISLPSGSTSVTIALIVGSQQSSPSANPTFYVHYNYVHPTPEPTPVPSPYISVTELYSDNLGTVYRLQCLPDADTIVYSAIVPYLIPAYQAGQYAEELRSADTVVEYRVPAGGTSVFSSVYATYPLTLGVISTTITAPPLTPAENQTYNPIPDPAQKPLTPFTSGKFQPTLTSGQVDVISKSPYVALLSNLNQSMQLPIMDSPDSIRNKLVPDDLENITGPLYDTAAGWAEFTNFVPRLIADTMIGVYSPFLSAIADCKSVLLSFTGQLAELMKPVYILSPVFYLFIPDLVWIGVCLVLVLLIIHALLVFVLGEDTVVYFMGRDTIVADAIPDFPALEK